MDIKEKLEILIKRNGYKKTEFADALGITYRGLANYINGTRYPRKKILENMSILLDVTPDLLTDNDKVITLTADEKLYFYGKSDKELLSECDDILKTVSDIFSDARMEEADRTAFFNCIAEKYFSSKSQKTVDKNNN